MSLTRLALVIPFLIALPSLSQQSVSPGTIPTLHVTTRIVALDVVVTDGHGHPTIGLKPSDLYVTEDGVPQTILSFVEHDATEAPQPAATPNSGLPPNTFTVQQPALGNGAVTVIVLGNVSWENAPFIRAQIKEFLAASPIATPIAIFRQDGQGMHLVQGLTTDRSVLLEAATSQRILPPLGFSIRFARLLGPPALPLARYLAQIPNRINLVWFGEPPPESQDQGLFADTSSSAPPGLAAFLHIEGGEGAVHHLGRISLYLILAGGLKAPNPQGAPENVSFAAAMNGLPCLEAMDTSLTFGGKAFCNNGFKEALTEVVNTGSHYYTISYRPTNPNWNGKYRNIKIELASEHAQSTSNKLIDYVLSGPAFMQPHILYREGYYARDIPPALSSDLSSAPTISSTGLANETAAAPHRTLISVSPRGQEPLPKTPMERAMGFGTLTPTQVHFTIVATPSSQAEKLKPGDPLPPNTFLTGAFHNVAYSNVRIHYWIDPQYLHFTPDSSGGYADQLQFDAVVYRDDGLLANSLSYTSHIQISADQIEDIQSNGLTFDQTIAIPIAGNPIPGHFFLRAGVVELSTGHIGALEIPTEWIKPTQSSGTP